MLIQEVLEELVPLVLLDELEELFVAEGLRGLLVTTGDPEILPVAQRRDEVVLGPLSLLPLLLLGTLLGLRHELREALLPLARSVEGVEAPVLLDKLQRLLPLHGGLHALLLQELHEGRPPLLWRRPLGLLLLLLLLARLLNEHVIQVDLQLTAADHLAADDDAHKLGVGGVERIIVGGLGDLSELCQGGLDLLDRRLGVHGLVLLLGRHGLGDLLVLGLLLGRELGHLRGAAGLASHRSCGD
mmetsp:Transcript_57049/g.137919  ORF Transcript_57049/g.137919 Transcript_57049/m.137919 type:complete len:243 (-) Transcript_57049:74-802(-)